MFRPRTELKQPLPYLVVAVQSCCFDYYTLYCVGNMDDKFHRCTVDLQAATVVYNNARANPAVDEYT